MGKPAFVPESFVAEKPAAAPDAAEAAELKQVLEQDLRLVLGLRSERLKCRVPASEMQLTLQNSAKKIQRSPTELPE